ncbi:MAG: NADH-ubiquinone oxidoreductase-F iron-sulfur binding region domain-containing protein, partial [Acidimicrobiales bacterium]
IARARDIGWLGDNILGSGFGFDVGVFISPGGYILGEETALLEALEDRRGEPRNKPPYPTTHGLFGAPTAVNNPETLVNVLGIVTDGPDAYRSVGTDDSPGTKLFCLSGHVDRPGLYELPFGITLGSLIERAGGSPESLQVVLLGGAAGSFVGPDQLDLPLSLEATRDAGLSLGSGVVMVFDDTVEMAPVVTRIAEFFRNESCGQCVPCRVGTVRQHELLVGRDDGGRPDAAHLDTDALDTDPLDTGLLDEIAQVMADASICGLGHTASTAVRSAIALGLIGAM